MAIIEGLPPELTEIPPSPNSPDDPDRESKREAFMRWREEVVRYRVERQILLKHQPDLIPFELAKCANDPAYFSSIWLRVFEPRIRKTGTMYIPFIPFSGQVDAMNAVRQCLHADDENADIAWSKARGWGASWIGCQLGFWGWLFSDQWTDPLPWNVLYLSRKEEYVDSKKQRSLFWKIRRLMRDIPPWMVPEGWDPDHHDQKGILINPANGNELAGESTNSNAGRGDRVTWAWLDEAAAMAEFMGIWMTVAETTDHRVAVSTESMEQGPDFYNLVRGEEMDYKPLTLTSDWWENPLNDDEWLDRQRIRYSARIEDFNREILRDPRSGGATYIYGAAMDIQPDPTVQPVFGRPSYVTADPGFRDPTALVAIQEAENGTYVILDGYQMEGKPADFFAPLLNPQLFAVDDDAWFNAPYLTWTSTRGEPQIFEYGEREISFATTVAEMGSKPTYVGDPYGNNITGASLDSVYSRWELYGVSVHRNRHGLKETGIYDSQMKSYMARQQALKERLTGMRFSAKPGAVNVLKALRENRYKARDTNRPVANEPKTPLHDWSSHSVQAMEFWAVYMKHRRAVTLREVQALPKSSLAKTISHMGQKRYNYVRWSR